jgi:hypothetical protein
MWNRSFIEQFWRVPRWIGQTFPLQFIAQIQCQFNYEKFISLVIKSGSVLDSHGLFDNHSSKLYRWICTLF